MGGDEEEGGHEAPCHEGSSCSSSQGHEGDEEEGSHEAPCHEGSSACQGHEGDEEEGSHEAPCHEGCCASAHEGHEGQEVSVMLGLNSVRAMLAERYRID